MIDWSRVKPRETLVWSEPMGVRWLILALHGDHAWFKSEPGSTYHSGHKATFGEDWTICEPWDEVTAECHWVYWARETFGVRHYALAHRADVIEVDDPNYRIDGKRVFLRREA